MARKLIQLLAMPQGGYGNQLAGQLGSYGSYPYSVLYALASDGTVWMLSGATWQRMGGDLPQVAVTDKRKKRK